VSMSPGSIMPRYPWLITDKLDNSSAVAKITALRKIGVPYPDGYESRVVSDIEKQAAQVTANLKGAGIDAVSDTEIIALIAYLQRLGTDIKGTGGFTRFMNSLDAPAMGSVQPDSTTTSPVGARE